MIMIDVTKQLAVEFMPLQWLDLHITMFYSLLVGTLDLDCLSLELEFQVTMNLRWPGLPEALG
jgi:hypothetical protein